MEWSEAIWGIPSATSSTRTRGGHVSRGSSTRPRAAPGRQARAKAGCSAGPPQGMATAAALDAAVHGSRRTPARSSNNHVPEARRAHQHATLDRPGCYKTTPHPDNARMLLRPHPKQTSLTRPPPPPHPAPSLPSAPPPQSIPPPPPAAISPCSSWPTERRTYPLSPRMTIFSSLGRPAMVATPPPPPPPPPLPTPPLPTPLLLPPPLPHSAAADVGEQAPAPRRPVV